MINQAVRDGSWKLVQLSKNGPSLSDLFFADDMVLFAEASTHQLQVILICLNKFYMGSGQRVNLQKSNIFFSNNVNERLA